MNTLSERQVGGWTAEELASDLSRELNAGADGYHLTQHEMRLVLDAMRVDADAELNRLGHLEQAITAAKKQIDEALRLL